MNMINISIISSLSNPKNSTKRVMSKILNMLCKKSIWDWEISLFRD